MPITDSPATPVFSPIISTHYERVLIIGAPPSNFKAEAINFFPARAAILKKQADTPILGAWL